MSLGGLVCRVLNGAIDAGAQAPKLLSDWPVERLRDWPRHVNAVLSAGDLDALRRCTSRGSPLGSHDWVKQAVKRYGLESTLRSRGRPRKR